MPFSHFSLFHFILPNKARLSCSNMIQKQPETEALKLTQTRPPWMAGLVEPQCCPAFPLNHLDSEKWDLFTQKRGTFMVWVRAFRCSSSGRAVPCRAPPPCLEGTGTAGCLLYHTRLKISHQNNFCEMFLPSALGQHSPEAATLPSLSESHLQLQEFPSHPVLRP